MSDIPISIDTRHAVVARTAVEAGADIVNDVSGGKFDPDMFDTVGNLGVPMVLMHMRGTPETMQKSVQYNDVVADVAAALLLCSETGQKYGIHRWKQIIDPGIGFGKDLEGNLELLRGLNQIRTTCKGLPILLGTSRKGFIGKISGVTIANQRDPGTIASCVSSICLADQKEKDDIFSRNCHLIRVHNVLDCKQAMLVMDAIRNYT